MLASFSDAERCNDIVTSVGTEFCQYWWSDVGQDVALKLSNDRNASF